MHNITTPETGCYDLIDNCWLFAADGAPSWQGTNKTVNAACLAALAVCFSGIAGAYPALTNASNWQLIVIIHETWFRVAKIHPWQRSTFDFTRLHIDSDVPNYFNGFFNQRWVQEDLGVRVNFTQVDNSIVTAMFAQTGDAMIQGMSLPEKIVSNNIDVALVYGDRDYECNCTNFSIDPQFVMRS